MTYFSTLDWLAIYCIEIMLFDDIENLGFKILDFIFSF